MQTSHDQQALDIYTIKLPSAVMLGGAYDGGRISPIGQ